MVDPIPLRGVSMHDGVAARLRSQVFDRVLPPGAWIDETALAAQWQISRTPLREALKVLAAEGLVELVPRRGARVTELTDLDAEQLFPDEATLRASAADLAQLQRWHDQLEQHAQAQDLDGYYRINHEFHALVQQLAANRWLDRATGDLRRFMRLWRGRQLKLPGRIGASINEHRVLLAAMCARDPQRAERAMHDHLMAQLAALKALQQQEQAATPTPHHG
ncbi:MAG: GntR family transcriptional regulator [Burkholderiales bacterium PBB5]|nr:MAG: GntR family transcriptional regulator [Burkholderiales bacterium PBB5]